MTIPNPRHYGNPPYIAALIHGGPGANGEMAPVARALSDISGVIEPLQTTGTVDGQIDELVGIVKRNGSHPLTLIGHSWGAWLAVLTAARYPECADCVVLVSSGPFEERYTAGIMDTRLSRLSPVEHMELDTLLPLFAEGAADAEKYGRFGALMAKADAYDLLDDDSAISEPSMFRPDIYRAIWPEAAELRRTGALLDAAAELACPVTAIHGDHDPHPAAGVERPLSRVVRDFRFILLERCGHKPWIERHAEGVFYTTIKNILTNS